MYIIPETAGILTEASVDVIPKVYNNSILV